MHNENLLRSYKNVSKSRNAQKIAGIMNDLRNAVFGSLLQSELDDADDVKNVDIRDMPPLETEEEAAKRQQKVKD